MNDVPQRLQRSRRKGSRLPSEVVVVTRPTKWGNPHPLELGRAEAVRRYREDLLAGRLAVSAQDVRQDLRGRDLACYCPLDEPCHADVLLAIANEQGSDIVTNRLGVMLLAEELALVSLDPGSGRPALGTRDNLNACLAGLLIAELALDNRPNSALLDAAQSVVDEAGPRPKAVLSAMSRGLHHRLGKGTWDAVVGELVARQVVAPPSGGVRPRTEVIDQAGREALVARLRAAATGDEPLDVRTALVLSMTGPAQLLELIAPERSHRRHARDRIDHALDGTFSEPVADAVRKVLSEAAAAVAGAVAATAVISSG